MSQLNFFQSKPYLDARAKAQADIDNWCPYCLNPDRKLWASKCRSLEIYPPCERDFRIETGHIIFNNVAQVYLIIVVSMVVAMGIILGAAFKFF